MNYTLFDSEVRNQLLPFTHTRPIADIRCGILTMRERWEFILKSKTATLCPTFMQKVFPAGNNETTVYINGSVFATVEILESIQLLKINEKLVKDGFVIAAKIDDTGLITFENLTVNISEFNKILFLGEVKKIEHIWDIFQKNEDAIIADFTLITKGNSSQPIPEYVTTISPEYIFIEEGAIINPCIINASKGPIYIGANAEIMEGCMLRGPIALGKNAVLKMGAKVYGATTIGEACKVGGEVSNVVFFANSNKGHDGFIGNAVIGEWCNLGADTNCSNLKNNYDTIKIWNEHENKLVGSGLQFCGLMMGDHSKSGINTMFNTGTVVGVSSNIFGSSFPEKFVPSFSWGGAGEVAVYEFDKAMETACRMMERRKIIMSEAERKMYQYLFDNRVVFHSESKFIKIKKQFKMRKKIVAGNWKMNLNLGEGNALITAVLDKLPALSEEHQVVFATPYLHLSQAITQTQYTAFVSIAAQNCHQEKAGVYTGEVSAPMLKDAGVRYVLIGHSERRAFNNENNALLAAKTNAAIEEKLTVIFCCGESLDIRDAGTQDEFVKQQLQESLFHLDGNTIGNIVIAYEPIWAIGTGRTASAAQAQEMHHHIRQVFAAKYGSEVAHKISILYGGSCKGTNAKELFAGEDVDGGLIGGASLDADDFLRIIKAMVEKK